MQKICTYWSANLMEANPAAILGTNTDLSESLKKVHWKVVY